MVNLLVIRPTPLVSRLGAVFGAGRSHRSGQVETRGGFVWEDVTWVGSGCYSETGEGGGGGWEGAGGVSGVGSGCYSKIDQGSVKDGRERRKGVRGGGGWKGTEERGEGAGVGRKGTEERGEGAGG